HSVTTGVNRLVGQQPVLLEKGAEAPNHTQCGLDRRRCQAMALYRLKPGIHIGRGQTGHILPEGRLPRRGQQPIEWEQGSEGGLQRFGPRVTGSQVGQVLRHEVLIQRADEGQPVEGQGWLLRRHTVLLLQAPLLWSVIEEYRSLST